MSEILFSVIAYSSSEYSDSVEPCLPLPIAYFGDIKSFERKITSISKSHDSRIRRYFVLLYESFGADVDYLYEKMEENHEILEIFVASNESSIPRSKYTKLCYIPKESIDLIIGLTYVNYLKVEMEKTTKLNQISLTKIYLRKAEKTKDWLMANVKAEPCHILIIPLNTNIDNLNHAVKRIREICIKIGHPRSIVRSFDEYIPKNEIYNKLPYGKLIFESEDPRLVCRWLRTLGSIRLYLYGNDSTISSEWSKQMIMNEPDPAAKTISDEELCSFLENEPIRDDIKWNFFTRHAQTWQIKQLTPLKIESLNDNIRFRSALRRAHINFADRMTLVTSQVYDWYDECRANGYIAREFKLIRRDKPAGSGDRTKDIDGERSPLSPQIENRNYSITINEKGAYAYTVSYSSCQTNDMINYQSSKSDQVFLWLDSDLFYIEPRFQSIIFPNEWKYFSNVDQCQKYILNEQIQSNTRIYLISSYILAEQLFAYEHISKVHAVYLYANTSGFRPGWINNFSMIRGIYQDFSTLFEQLESDLTTNSEMNSYQNQLQETENRDLLPISFFDTDHDSFCRNRALIDILSKSPDKSEARQEMIDEFRRISSENSIVSERIDDFEVNYHSNAAIQWYTKDSFLYRLISQVLREGNVEKLRIFRCFIIDLHQRIDELHKQYISSNFSSEQSMLTLYRGQTLSLSEIEQFKQQTGQLISTNTFLSTTASLDVALMYADARAQRETILYKPVIFSIEVYLSITNTRPYAIIDNFSAYEHEDEVLFTIGSVFRIEKVDFSTGSDDIHVIHLKMVDENDVPKEYISQLNPEQNFIFSSDRNYVIVGLPNSFKTKEHYEQIKSRLEDNSVQFFDNTNDLDDYTKSIETMKSFVIFLHTRLQLPERYQHSKIISFSEEDMHWNDLIYQLLYEMEHDKREKDLMKNLYMDIANIYCSSSIDKTGFLYVQFIHSARIPNDSEEELKSKLPSSASLLTFYQTESCINFLQSIIEPETIGNVRLIIWSDQTNLDKLINQFESLQSIKFIYICSKNAFDIPSRRIIHGKFLNLNDLYLQLHTDHLYQSFCQANQQIELYQNKTEAKKFFQDTNQFLKLINEHQNNF